MRWVFCFRNALRWSTPLSLPPRWKKACLRICTSITWLPHVSKRLSRYNVSFPFQPSPCCNNDWSIQKRVWLAVNCCILFQRRCVSHVSHFQRKHKSASKLWLTLFLNRHCAVQLENIDCTEQRESYIIAEGLHHSTLSIFTFFFFSPSENFLLQLFLHSCIFNDLFVEYRKRWI